MTRKNLPNIPIYIGDWERDCNCLSLVAEMAWMKIIFKMHLNGKQSTSKQSAKGLQILWKSSAEQVKEIIEELKFNSICEIRELSGGYEFKSRRFERENLISLVRSKVGKKGVDAKKKKVSGKQTLSKASAKGKQNADNDIDYDYDNNNEIDNLLLKHPRFEKKWDEWKKYKKQQFGFRYKLISEKAALTKLHNLATGNVTLAMQIIDQSTSQGWKGFFPLKAESAAEVNPATKWDLDAIREKQNKIEDVPGYEH